MPSLQGVSLTVPALLAPLKLRKLLWSVCADVGKVSETFLGCSISGHAGAVKETVLVGLCGRWKSFGNFFGGAVFQGINRTGK